MNSIWGFQKFPRIFARLCFAIAILFSTTSLAQNGPHALNISGGLFHANGTPIADAAVNFKIDILDPTAACVLYTEQHLNQDLRNTRGAFSLQLGAGTSAVNNLNGGATFTSALFTNNGATGVFTGCPAGVTLAAGSERLIRVSYDLGSGYIAMTPEVPIVSAAYAMVAETLDGKTAANFVQTDAVALTQANVTNIFSNVNYPKLDALVNGTSTQYMVTAPTSDVDFNGRKITSVAAPTAGGDAANKTYVDGNLGGKTVDVSGVGVGVGGGRTLMWDQALNKWYTSPVAGAVSQIVGGAGLLGGTITSTGTLSVDTGNTANKIVRLDGFARLPGVDGSQLTNLTVPVTSVAGRTGAVTLIAADIGGLGTAALKNYGVAANNLVELNASAQLPAVDAFLLSNVNAKKLQGYDIATTAPSAGQVLTWNVSAAKWEPGNTAVTGITQLYGDVVAVGPGLTNAVIQPNAVTSAKINSTGNTVNQLLITDSVTGTTVTYANSCAVGEILKWTVTGWMCAPDSGAGGFVTSVVSGSGLVAGTISSTGTINVDVGTTAGKILRVTAGTQYPAVDGNLISNVNAVKLQARNVSNAAPGAGTVLGWNVSAAQWEPLVAATGSVQTVTSGAGLVPNTFTTNGTINVDVGVTGNKIVQLTVGAQLPAVDGNLVSNVNAVKLQAHNVSNAAPATGQVLGWNGNSSQWEPYSTATGSVMQINTGTGLVGATITASGTLSVDVGVTASKIIQLTAGAQIPAVDGNLVSNVNAVKIQGKDISASAPGGAQVLRYNSSTAVWEPSNDTVGTMTGVVAGLGIVPNTVTTYGTLNIDVGVSAGKILQVTAGTQYPAVDGNLISNVNAVKLQARNVSNAAPGAGTILGWNVVAAQWEPLVAATGSVQTVTSGAGLVPNTFTTNGTINVDVGVTGNKIVQLTAGAQLPPVDGNLVSNVNAVKLQARDVSNAAPGGGQFLGWNSSNSKWEPTSGNVGSVTGVVGGTGVVPNTITGYGTINIDVGTAANKIVQITASTQYPGVDGNLISNVNAVKLQARNVSNSAPVTGQVLGWNGNLSQWEPFSTATGSVMQINTGTGLVGATITSSGTLSVDVGVTANKVLQLTAGAQIPAVDGNLVSNVNAVKLQARNVSNAAPGAGTVLGWNVVAAQWEPLVAATGSVQTVTSGAGLVPNTFTTNGTLNVDVGVTGSKIVQLTAGAQLPAVDGNLVSNVNAVKLQGRNVAATAPSNNSVVTWNSTTSVWEPQAAQAGANAFVAGGNSFLANTNIGLTDAYNLSIITNNSVRVTVTASGNVGIGVTSPVAPLQVYATATSADRGIVVGYNANGSVIRLQKGRLGVVQNGDELSRISVGGWDGSAYTESAKIVSYVDNSVSAGIVPSTLQFHTMSSTGAYAERLRITSAGNVGIGTTSPQAALDVNGTGTFSAIIVPRETTALRPSLAVNGMIRYNTNTSKFEAYESGLWTNMVGAGTVGTVTSVVAGTGISPNTITANGTLNVDVGVTNGKIVQIGAGGQLPAVDGNLVSNVNAVKLQSRDVSNAAPGVGTVLGWNNGSAKWEPVVAATGSVTSVVAGNGIVPNTVSTNGTLSIDVGTTTGKIVQLGAGGTMPAVDGYLLSNLNVTKLQGRNVASIGPTDSYVLTWNASASNWEPRLAPGAATGFVNGGNAFGGAATLGTNDNNTLTLLTNSAARLTIDQLGNVTTTGKLGVGTATPATTLDVIGNGQIKSSTLGDILSLKTTLLGGTDSSNFSLDTVGAPAASNQLSIQLKNNGSVAARMDYRTGSKLRIGTEFAEPVTFFTNGNANERMVINATGNVGIGTTSPQSILDVNGTGTVQSAMIVPRETSALRPYGINGMIRYNTNTNKFEFYESGAWGNYAGTTIGFLNGGNAFGGTASLGTTDIANLNILTCNNVAMTITSRGNVGIGTTTPTYLLDVSGTMRSSAVLASAGTAPAPSYSFSTDTTTGVWLSGASTIGFSTSGTNRMNLSTASLTSTTANGPSLVFTGASAASPGYTFNGDADTGWFHPSADTLAAATGGVERMRMDISGSVGIGTNAPTAALDVNGTGTFSALVVPRDTTALRPNAVNGMIRYNTNTSKFEGFENGVWINVATGTFGNGDFKADGSVPMTGNFNAVKGSPTLPAVSFVGDTGTGMYDVGVGTLGFATNGSARMTLDSSGNLGVGTTSPSNKLTTADANKINGTSSAAFGYAANANQATYTTDAQAANVGALIGIGGMRDNAATVPSVFAGLRGAKENSTNGNASGYLGFYTANSGVDFAERVRISSSGNVGIGTASPGAKLQVDDTTQPSERIRLSGQEYFQAGNTSSAGLSFLLGVNRVNNKQLWIGDSANLAQNSTNTVARIGVFPGLVSIGALATDGVTTQTLTLNGTGGNVGIGTTAPAAALDVVGIGTNSAMVVPRDTTANRPATNTINGMIRYNTSLSKFEAYEAGVWTNMTASGAGLTNAFVQGGNAFGTTASLGTTSATNLNIITGGSPRVTVTASGNVGIGTTTPSANLEVSGVRPFSVNTSGFNEASFKGDPGGWAFRYGARGSADTDLGGYGVYGGADALNYYWIGSSFAAPSMAILPSGYVGIGTLNPSSGLQVSRSGGAWTTSTWPTNLELGSGPATAGLLRFPYNSSTQFGIGSTVDGKLRFIRSAAADSSAPANYDMTIDTTGNVGIGTTAPNSNLHIYGSTPKMRIESSAGTDPELWIDGPAARTRRIGFQSSGLTRWTVNADSISESGSNAGSDFSIYRFNDAGSYVDAPFTIQRSTGNVGIGTTSPGTPLQVDASESNLRLNSTGGTGGRSWDIISGSNGNASPGIFTIRDSTAGNNIFGIAGGAPANSMFINSSGNVGIGTTSPAYTLDVNGVITSRSQLVSLVNSGFTASLRAVQVGVADWTLNNIATTGRFDISETGVAKISILPTGNVGIGLTNPTYQLQLSTDSAAKPGTSTWTIASDERLKDIRAPFTRGLDAINGLNTIYFNYKKDNPLGLPSEKEYVGIKAQDAQKVIPEAVSTDKQGYLHVTNDSIIWTAVNAIKELYSKVMGHEQHLASHDREIASVKAEKADKTSVDAQLKAKDQKIKELEQRLDKIEKMLNSK